MNYFILLLVSACLSACSLTPTYHRPTIAQPSHYKETGKWLRAKPKSAALGQGEWWQEYHDPILNALEARINCNNQTLKAALARFDEARAALKVAKAAYFPTITGVANVNRQQSSNAAANPPNRKLFSDYLVGVDLNYEVDLWGKIRNAVASARYQANASAADVAFVSLNLHAELAKDYFALRGADDVTRVLDETVVAYQRALSLTTYRFQGGASPALDVDEAKNQLETAKTAAADIRLQRAQLEHAIAILLGVPPADFTIKPKHTKPHFVVVTPHLPSTLLERRPDIAEAEYLVQAANARIGVARAAFFPDLNLAAAAGFDSGTLRNLLRSSSFVWSLGPTAATALLNNGSMPELTQIIFDGGRISGLTDEAWAVYCETVANYRQTVLTAYQEVEDNLAAIRQLDREYHTQSAATLAADKALAQAMYRYKGGLTTYLDVVVIQNIALQAEESDINIRTRRQLASVQLIRALGGGWMRC